MSTVIRFRIELQDVSPPIRRRIEAPVNYSFWDLYVAIQDAMDWADSHLHVFEIDDGKEEAVSVGIPDPDEVLAYFAAWRRKLTRYFKKSGDQVISEYDFTASWRRSMLLASITCPDDFYPRSLVGNREPIRTVYDGDFIRNGGCSRNL